MYYKKLRASLKMKNKRTAVMISCSSRWYHPKTEWRSRTDIIQGLISGPKSNQQWNVVLNHRLPTYYSNETYYTHISKLMSLLNVFWPICSQSVLLLYKGNSFWNFLKLGRYFVVCTQYLDMHITRKFWF